MNGNGGGDTRNAMSQIVIALWDAVNDACDTRSEEAVENMLRASQALHEAIEHNFAPPMSLSLETNRTELDANRLYQARIDAESEPDSDRVTISARVPKFMADYIGLFAHRSKAQRRRSGRRELTKQEIIIEAICLFIAVHQLPPQREDIVTRIQREQQA